MTTHGMDWSMFRDVRNSCGPEEYRTPDEIDCRMSANVGDLMAVAMAAAGTFALVTGGRTACETDYLAASGATFPASVTYEQMVDFNRRTLKPCMSEEDEWRRYAAIAGFWRRAACRTRIR